MGQSLKTWVTGTVLLCVVVLGLGGFLVVKPQFDQASALDSQTEDLRRSNADLADDVAELKAQFAQIDQYRADIAAGRVKIPESVQSSALLREIQAVADATGVVIVISNPGDPQPYVVPEAEEAEATAEPSAEPTAEATASAEGADPDADLAAAVATATDITGFYAVPVTLDVVGPYGAVRSFVDGIQHNALRFFLAGDFTLTHLDPSEAQGGRPAVEAGDVELAMEIATFVLTPGEGLSSEAPAKTPLPQTPTDRNPFDQVVPQTTG